MSMQIRISIEDDELQRLSPRAAFSRNSKGRKTAENPCSIRTAFQHDRDRILHSKAFRRLKHKTQVFLSPEGDHYRTRLTHTLEVAQIARTLARALRLNEDLTEAIALGHDLGHTPFGHAGERVLHDLLPQGFRHAQQSLRVVDVLEKNGSGLNLTAEVRQGILAHSKGKGPLLLRTSPLGELTLEAQLVRVADVVAYVNHDLDDALRAGVVRRSDVPQQIRSVLGSRHSQRIDRMVQDVVAQSLSVSPLDIVLSSRMEDAVLALRCWLSEHVYCHDAVHEDFLRASRVLQELFNYFVTYPDRLEAFGGSRRPEDEVTTSVADFIAGMSDRFALALYDRLFMPKPWKVV